MNDLSPFPHSGAPAVPDDHIRRWNIDTWPIAAMGLAMAAHWRLAVSETRP